LADKYVTVDKDTLCEPNDDYRDVYAKLLTRQSDLTKRLHTAGYL
jgi:hypothetical protein